MEGQLLQGESSSYLNKEHERGKVEQPVPEGFKDLSLEHQPLGTLCDQIKVRKHHCTFIMNVAVHYYRILPSGLHIA